MSKHQNIPDPPRSHTHTTVQIALTCNELDREPSVAITALAPRLAATRWFMEKDAAVQSLSVEDRLPLAKGDGWILEGVVARFVLKAQNDRPRVKRYFVPIILATVALETLASEDAFLLVLRDGQRNFYLAEQTLVFANAILELLLSACQKDTRRGGRIVFKHLGEQLTVPADAQWQIRVPDQAFSSSNVITRITSKTHALVCKTYKDLRGNAGVAGKAWTPNMEPERFRALSAAQYPNIPKLAGTADYISASGHRAPLIVISEAVPSAGQLGDVFSTGLARMLSSFDGPAELNYREKQKHLMHALRILIRQTIKTVVAMQAAFLSHDKTGFDILPAANETLRRRLATIRGQLSQAMAAIEARCQKQPQTQALRLLAERLTMVTGDGTVSLTGGLSRAVAGRSPSKTRIMVTQVHGDLHLDQALLSKTDTEPGIDAFLDLIETCKFEDIDHHCTRLAARIRWIDFEGPPARQAVPVDFDTRESPLVDLAGLAQSLLYIANTGLFAVLGLDHRNRSDHEQQRRVSLALVGQLAPDRAEIEASLLAVARQWLEELTTVVVENYLDEIERQQLQTCLLSPWDRPFARALAYDWILARALHEFGYETYGRDWGWEAVAGGRALQLLTDQATDDH